MAEATTFTADLLALIFTAKPIAHLAQNAGAAPVTVITVALHTAKPSDGRQSTHETTYTGYARRTLPRTAGAWSVSTVKGVGSVSPMLPIDFPEVTGAPGDPITHFSVAAGDRVLICGQVRPPIAMVTHMIPRLAATSTITLGGAEE